MADGQRTRQRARSNGGIGLAIDSSGRPAYDPSENVLQVTNAAVERIDDMAALQALLVDEKIKRMEREWIHQEKVALLREEFSKEIRRLDADRLEKIRAVDVSNAAATAAQLLAAVQTLASTAAGTAETLRNQVTATAAAVASQTERIINPIIERVGLLERSQYTISGRTAVADPQMEKLAQAVELLVTNQTKTTGKTEGISLVGVVVAGAVSLLVGLTVLGSFLYAVLK